MKYLLSDGDRFGDRAALYATLALAKWLRAVAREAEVAGLVEDVMDCANDMVGAAESYSPFVLRSATANMRVALDRLARLAEEVSGG